MGITMLKAWAIIAPTIAAIGSWIVANKETIQAIILRVQKDAADGLTGAELEQIAVDMFFEKVYPTLPWYAKLLGKGFWESRVRGIVKKFCAKSHLLKE